MTENNEQAQLPMFYSNPMCVDSGRHLNAGLLPATNCEFAAHTNSISINAHEFVEAAKFYPIVFTDGELPMPAVILGLETDNYFVDTKNQWMLEHYVPGYVRKYPFILLHIADKKEFVLCVDEGSKQFCAKPTKGMVPLYDTDGKPSEMAQAAFVGAMEYHNQFLFTRQFAKAIQDADLLVSNVSSATLSSGRVINLQGFGMIDEKKFNALSDDVILDFHKNGWLPLIHFALMSASNWRRIAELASLKEEPKQ